MILIIERKSNDVIALLNQAGACLETIPNQHLKEYSRVFHLILQGMYSFLSIETIQVTTHLK